MGRLKANYWKEVNGMAPKTRRELEEEVASLTDALEQAREALETAAEVVDEALGVEEEDDDSSEPKEG